MRRLLPLLAVTAPMALVAGCTVGPNFTPPAAPQASGYVAASDPHGHGPAALPGEGPTLRWWTAFGSPQLDALVDQAIAHNASLEASNATLAAAREMVAAARGKALPQVDANASVHEEQVNLAAFGFTPNPALGLAGNPRFELYSVGGGVSYDLDLFGKNRRTIERTGAQAEAQLHQTEAAHLAVAGQVVGQALQIAAIRSRIATEQALLADDRRTLDLTQKRKAAGEGTLVEVLGVQSQLENDGADLPQLDQQLAEARHLLATLVGVAPSDLGPTDFDLASFALPASIPVALPSALVHKRPDILQAEADLHAATAAVGVATAAMYPDVSLGASFQQGATSLANLFSTTAHGFDLFAGLTAPIFHGGTLKAEKRAAVDRAQAADATYRQTVLDSFRQVADLVVALDSDARTVSNHEGAVAVAGHSAQLQRKSFQVGNSGILDTIEAQRRLQTAQIALVAAKSRQLQNVARLYVATAGGWTGPALASR